MLPRAALTPPYKNAVIRKKLQALTISTRTTRTHLSSNSVRSSGEKLCNTGSVKTSFGKTESSTKTSTTSANDYSIVFVINDGIFASN
jgi:hypothetical protein